MISNAGFVKSFNGLTNCDEIDMKHFNQVSRVTLSALFTFKLRPVQGTIMLDN